MNYAKALWMGNIENGMNEESIKAIYKKISILYYILDIIPTKINIKLRDNQKKGYCFVEFASQNIANKVFQNYNGKKINNFTMMLNPANPKNKNNMDNKIYTVSIIYYY